MQRQQRSQPATSETQHHKQKSTTHTKGLHTGGSNVTRGKNWRRPRE